MNSSLRRTLAAGLAALAAMLVSAASAMTISHATPRQPAAFEAAPAASSTVSLPYTCDKAELGTRLKRRACR